MSLSTHLQKRFKSTNPGANLFHCREPNATDMIYSNTPAIDGGKTCLMSREREQSQYCLSSWAGGETRGPPPVLSK